MNGEKKNLKERIRRIASRQKILASASLIAILIVVVFSVTVFGQKVEAESDFAPQRAFLDAE